MGEIIKVDEQLLAEASKLTGELNGEKVVEQALREMIRRRAKLRALLDLVGKVEFHEGYDHKSLRKTRYDAP